MAFEKKSIVYRYLLIVFSLLGLGAMTYVAVGPTNTCNIYGSILNCDKVLTSPYATYLGIHLYVYGLVFFSLSFALSVLYSLKLKAKKEKHLILSLFSLNILGAVAAIYLIYLELFQIGAICIFCTTAHISIFALLIVSLLCFLHNKTR